MKPKKMMKLAREALKSGSNERTEFKTNKGHFVVYTMDESRFVMPLSYLENNVVLELLRMSKDEFGLPKNKPITLPCDSVVMNYLVSVLERGCTKELEKALLASFRG